MLKLFTVSGDFLIPGTRKKATCPFTKVFARDLTHACVQMAPFLSDRVAKLLPRDVRLTPDFIRYNLRIKQEVTETTVAQNVA